MLGAKLYSGNIHSQELVSEDKKEFGRFSNEGRVKKEKGLLSLYEQRLEYVHSDVAGNSFR